MLRSVQPYASRNFSYFMEFWKSYLKRFDDFSISPKPCQGLDLPVELWPTCFTHTFSDVYAMEFRREGKQVLDKEAIRMWAGVLRILCILKGTTTWLDMEYLMLCCYVHWTVDNTWMLRKSERRSPIYSHKACFLTILYLIQVLTRSTSTKINHSCKERSTVRIHCALLEQVPS